MNFSISVGFLELLLLILLWFTENISENYFDIPENLWKRERGREKPHNMQMRGWENWPMWSGSPWGQRVIQGVNVPNLNRFLTIDTWRRIWRGCFFILDWFFPLSLSLSLSENEILAIFYLFPGNWNVFNWKYEWEMVRMIRILIGFPRCFWPCSHVAVHWWFNPGRICGESQKNQWSSVGREKSGKRNSRN